MYYSNQFIAHSSGVPTWLLNRIERTFSQLVDYLMFVSPQQYEWYLNGMRLHTDAEQAQLKVLIANSTQPLAWVIAQ